MSRRRFRAIAYGAIAILAVSVSIGLPGSAAAWYTGGVFWQKNTNSYYCTTAAFNAHAGWIPALDTAVDNYNNYSNGGSAHPQWTAGCPHANHPIDVLNVPLGDIHYGAVCGNTSNTPSTTGFLTHSYVRFNSDVPYDHKLVKATATGNIRPCTSSDIPKAYHIHAIRRR